MEDKKLNHSKDEKEEDIEMVFSENNEITINSSLFEMKDALGQNIEKLTSKDFKDINEQEELDNTNSNIIFEKLKLKPSKKLLFDSFDILSKKQLSQFKITKKYNNRETYFYFLEYIINVKIIKNKDEERDSIDEDEDEEPKAKKIKALKIQIMKKKLRKIMTN